MPTTSQLEQKPLDERGGGKTNESNVENSHRCPERDQSSPQRPQEVMGRPDIEYQGLKIDLSAKEWVIVGIIAVIIAILLR